MHTDDIVRFEPQGLRTRFMLFTNPNRREAVSFGEEIWAEKRPGHGYNFGTELELINPQTGRPDCYLVANIPLIRSVDHPEMPGHRVALQVVYVVHKDVWVLYKDLSIDDIHFPGI
nr:hypothetical protein [uncultured Arsenicibacter sp.]